MYRNMAKKEAQRNAGSQIGWTRLHGISPPLCHMSTEKTCHAQMALGKGPSSRNETLQAKAPRSADFSPQHSASTHASAEKHAKKNMPGIMYRVMAKKEAQRNAGSQIGRTRLHGISPSLCHMSTEKTCHAQMALGKGPSSRNETLQAKAHRSADFSPQHSASTHASAGPPEPQHSANTHASARSLSVAASAPPSCLPAAAWASDSSARATCCLLRQGFENQHGLGKKTCLKKHA